MVRVSRCVAVPVLVAGTDETLVVLSPTIGETLPDGTGDTLLTCRGLVGSPPRPARI